MIGRKILSSLGDPTRRKSSLILKPTKQQHTGQEIIPKWKFKYIKKLHCKQYQNTIFNSNKNSIKTMGQTRIRAYCATDLWPTISDFAIPVHFCVKNGIWHTHG